MKDNFFVFALVILIPFLFMTSVFHCEVSLRVENGVVDAGVAERDPCVNFCPLDSGRAETLRIQNEELEVRRGLIRRLIHGRVWSHELNEKIVDAVASVSFYENVDPTLALAIIKVESNFVPRATSYRGAMGLMQLMPETARAVGTRHPYDIEENIRGGVRYLKVLYTSFGGDVRKVAAAYNAGPAAVRYFHGVPPFPETTDYVRKVYTEKRRFDREKRIYETVRVEL